MSWHFSYLIIICNKGNINYWWVCRYNKETTEVFFTRFLSVLPSKMTMVKLRFLRLELKATPKLFRCDYPKVTSVTRRPLRSMSLPILMRKAQSPAKVHPNSYCNQSHSWKATSICRRKQLHQFRASFGVTSAPWGFLSMGWSESNFWQNLSLVATVQRILQNL